MNLFLEPESAIGIPYFSLRFKDVVVYVLTLSFTTIKIGTGFIAATGSGRTAKSITNICLKLR